MSLFFYDFDLWETWRFFSLPQGVLGVQLQVWNVLNNMIQLEEGIQGKVHSGYFSSLLRSGLGCPGYSYSIIIARKPSCSGFCARSSTLSAKRELNSISFAFLRYDLILCTFPLAITTSHMTESQFIQAAPSAPEPKISLRITSKT